METVGIRELKNKLSAYVRRAEAGDVIVVTDRGRIVAELVPPGHGAHRPDIHPGFLELARRDGFRLPKHPNSPELYRRPLPRVDLDEHSVQDMIDFLREDRA